MLSFVQLPVSAWGVRHRITETFVVHAALLKLGLFGSSKTDECLEAVERTGTER